MFISFNHKKYVYWLHFFCSHSGIDLSVCFEIQISIVKFDVD